MRTFWPSVKCGLTIMGSSPLNDTDIGRTSFKSSYSRAVAWRLCLISVRYLPCMDGIPRGTKLCQQPGAWVKGYTMYCKTVCQYTLYHGGRGRAYERMYFSFLGGGGGISRGLITGTLW